MATFVLVHGAMVGGWCWATTNVGFVAAWLTTLVIRRRLPVCNPHAADFATVATTCAGSPVP
jgi:hypothetical protein